MTDNAWLAGARAKLEQIDAEAAQLLSQKDGVHNMHGLRWGIHGWLSHRIENVDWENVDILIRAMRICAAGGECSTSKLDRRPGVSFEDI